MVYVSCPHCKKDILVPETLSLSITHPFFPFLFKTEKYNLFCTHERRAERLGFFLCVFGGIPSIFVFLVIALEKRSLWPFPFGWLLFIILIHYMPLWTARFFCKICKKNN